MTNTIIFDTRREDDSSSSSSEQFEEQQGDQASSSSVYSAIRNKIRRWIHPRDSIWNDLGIENKPNIFSYAELRTATEDFCLENKLGEGGFGSVYKGTLSDGKEVAVKKLSSSSTQGKKEFFGEISVMSRIEHPNLVKLYGCCIKKTNRLLVYEYLENKSLYEALFGNTKLHLNWTARFNICLGVARGLTYLHEDSNPRIVHRDVKPSNILLDMNLIPKISDFGLAKLYDLENTHISTQVGGTP